MSKDKIKETIINFSKTNNFTESSKIFLKSLGLESPRQMPLLDKSYCGFISTFNQQNKPFHKEKAITDDWVSIDFLFQITDEEMNFNQIKSGIDHQNIESYLFFCLELKNEHYSKTKLAQITREINKLFMIPVLIIFKTGNFITLSIIDRRLHKKDAYKDVLEKVTFIKDIRLISPHRAHIDILYDLSTEKHNVNNFSELHKKWVETLSAELLNKNFYKELSNWYFWAIKNVEFPDDVEKDKELRNSTNLIRLITRVIFVWFIKEKGHVPESLFDEKMIKGLIKDFCTEGESPNYYKAILQNLFFGTLNQNVKERKFAQEGGISTNSTEYGVKNIYRYANLFLLKTEKEICDLFKDIPFLNGGLFDCLDKEDESKKVQYVDGFSRNKNKQAFIPDFLFFGKSRKEDLSEFYYVKNKIVDIEGLFNILNSYKFTVSENTPLEEDVALDPELLGRAFENLLGSYNPETKETARKQTGSFYTPRPIVDYMVKESLVSYLINSINSFHAVEETDGRDAVETAIRDMMNGKVNSDFIQNNKQKIIKDLHKIKILDPACGSGAFPMGILNKMVELLNLLDPDNIEWRKLQEEKATLETQDAYKNINNKDQRENRLIEINDIFENNSTDYGRKLFLIENCIYGVDIQPIAIQISKLRFFLSLVIEQQLDINRDNFGIRPLPNLETKFVTADTLICLNEDNEKTIEETDVRELETNLKEIENKLYKVRTRREIEQLEKQKKIVINKLAKIKHGIQSGFADEIIFNIIKELKELRAKHFSASTRKEKNNIQAQDKIIREKLFIELEKYYPIDDSRKIAEFDIYNQCLSSNWFDKKWMFGIEEGFDIVIGNPPYLKEGRVPKEMILKYKNSIYYQGKMDLWYMFACYGIDFLKNDGHLCFIATNNWTTSAGASILRNKIVTKSRIKQIADFGNFMIFESASIQTMVMLFSKNETIDNYCFDFRSLTGDTKLSDVNDLLNKCSNSKAVYLSAIIIRGMLKDKFLTFSSSEMILNKILDSGIFLTKDEIANGIHPHYDFISNKIAEEYNLLAGSGIFGLSNTEKDNLQLSDNELRLIKPYYTTEQIHRYYSDPKNELWLIYTNSSFKNPNSMNKYPNLKKHLDRFAGIITSDNKPYGLHRAREEDFFIGEKIVVQRKCANQPTFSYSDFDCYVSATFYVIKTTRFNHKYLVGILNSKLIAFWLRNKGKMQGNNYQLDKEPLMQIPIYNPTLEQQESIIYLVDQILLAKKGKIFDNNSLKLEKEIDKIVYELYGLTDDEIRVVENE